jgi:twinkle protein
MYRSDFEAAGIDTNGRSSGTTKTVCPVCLERKGKTKDKDLSINISSGLYKCHSQSCDYQGFIGAKKIKAYQKPEETYEAAGDKIKEYFLKRGINDITLAEAKVSKGKRESIRFDYYYKGEIVNWKIRYLNEKKFMQFPDARKVPYNVDSLKGKPKGILVEGETDALTWMQALREKDINDVGVISLDQGAANEGQNIDGKVQCLSNCDVEINAIDHWYLCLDADGPGKWTTQEVAKRIGKHKCSVVLLPGNCKDSNEVYKMYGVGGGNDKLIESLESAIPMVDGISYLDEDMVDRILEDHKNGPKRGSTTHFPTLDSLYTFLPGQITLVTGYPGSGKSEIWRTLMVTKSVRDGWKWGCFCPEETPAESFYYQLCTVLIGETDRDKIPVNDLKDALMFIKDHFFFIEPSEFSDGEVVLPSNKWINERLSLLRIKHGINGYMKDPWNKIFHDIPRSMREDQYLGHEISREKIFAKSWDAPIYVAHPNSRGSAKEMKDLKPPGPTNINGGAMFWNMFDNMITIHRDRSNEEDDADVGTGREPNIVKFMTNKIRKKRIVGNEGEVDLEYDYDKNRYYTTGDKRYSPLGEEDWLVSSTMELPLPF